MSIDFTKPVRYDTWDNIFACIRDNLSQVAKMFADGSGENKPAGAIRYDLVSSKFQRWDGSEWQPLTISGATPDAHVHDAGDITTGILAQARGGTGINTVTPTEYGYLSGVTSGIQAQLNGKLASTLKGAANGLAELDASGHVPAAQLPSYVDDVLEYANFASFPGTGETGKIYLALDTNIIYRWSGSAYAEISSSLALGETSSTAYRGDRGAAAYAAAVTNATNANTANTLVKRDASGNFSASNISGNLNGVASLATQLQSVRSIWGQGFNGTGNITGDMTGVGNITMGTEASKATLTFPYSATRTYTIPLVDTAAHFLMSKGDQAIDGTKTFNSTIVGSITGNAAFADGSTNAVNCSRQVIAGNGLTGGGFLNADRTVTMGTPGGCSNLTSNAVTSESHTHAITGFSLSTHNHAGVYATESHLHDASNITTGILAQARGGTGINTVTPTEYGYLSGVTSGIQAQLNGKLASALKGAANGLAELDASGHVPAAQLPSYVDDVLEYANFASFPGTGETGKIYLALDTNIIYRWSGSAYAEISSSLALGETSSTAYRGDRGAAAYAAAVTNATNANTANTLVKRDASGNFSAGTITAALSGNASTATTAAAAPWSGITDKPSSFAPSSHAVNASTYGYGDATNAGHLRVGSGLTVLSGTVSHSTGAGYNHIPSGGSSGQILGYASAGAAQWINAPSTSPAGNSGYIQFNNAGAFGGSSNLFWNNTNGRLGINEAIPLAPLHIKTLGSGTTRMSNVITTFGTGTTGKDICLQFSSPSTTCYIGTLSGDMYYKASATTNWHNFIGSAGIRLEASNSASIYGDIETKNISTSERYMRITPPAYGTTGGNVYYTGVEFYNATNNALTMHTINYKDAGGKLCQWANKTNAQEIHFNLWNGSSWAIPLVVRRTAVDSGYDNTYTCGSSGYRWTAVYATNGTIQTSDITTKRDVRKLTEPEKQKYINAILNTDLALFNFKNESGNKNNHIGFILNSPDFNTPDEFITDKKTWEYHLSDVVFALVAATQEMKKEIRELRKVN